MSPNTGASISSGFASIPAGQWYMDGTYMSMSVEAVLWRSWFCFLRLSVRSIKLFIKSKKNDT